MDCSGEILKNLLNMLREQVRETCAEVIEEYRGALKQILLSQMMTREQVAVMLGRDVKTIGRYESDGLICHKIGKTPMYFMEDVQSFIESRKKSKNPENN